MIRSALIFLFALLLSPLAQAQKAAPEGLVRPKFQDQLYFLDTSGESWVFLGAMADQPIIARHQGRTWTVPSPEKYGKVASICPSGTTLWAMAIEPSPSAGIGLFSLDLTQTETPGRDPWVRVAEVECENGSPTMLIPLKGENQFLGLACSPFLAFFEPSKQKASLAAIFRLRGERLVFEECVEMGFEDLGSIAKKTPRVWPGGVNPLPKDAAKTPWQESMCELTSPALEPSLLRPSVSKRYATLCAATAGVIWIFDLEKGQVCKTFNMDGLKKDDFAKLGRLDHSILGTAFDPRERLIVAKRDPALTRLSIELCKDPYNAAQSQVRAKDFAARAETFTEIQWFAIDPAEGTQTRLTSQSDFPSNIPSFRKQSLLKFLVTPLGIVSTNVSVDWESVKRRMGITPPERDPRDESTQKPAGEKSAATAAKP